MELLACVTSHFSVISAILGPNVSSFDWTTHSSRIISMHTAPELLRGINGTRICCQVQIQVLWNRSWNCLTCHNIWFLVQESCSYFCSILYIISDGLTSEIEVLGARKYFVTISNIHQGVHCRGCRFLLRTSYFDSILDQLHNFLAFSD
jgi:hypothetical protein